MQALVNALYRYPIKGLSPEALTQVKLSTGQPFPFDREYALALHDTVFDPNNPQYLSKTRFLMLMKNERLAALNTHFDTENHHFTIQQAGKTLLTADLRTSVGKAEVEQFFVTYMGDEIKGTPRVVHAPNFSFSDVAAKVISCINLESLRDLERTLGTSIHPLRFRANVYFEGIPAWEELSWIGKEFMLGTAKVRVMKGITRCAATNVNPETAQRDLQIPNALVKNYKHNFLGVYLEVLTSGELYLNSSFLPPI
jgi:uncharacterized protein YcbX